MVETNSVTIDSQNEYASVLVVSLDGQPLAQSRNVLVQVGTQARPTGWVEREATFKSDDGKQTFHGKQVVSTGAMPWAVEETRIKLTIKNPACAPRSRSTQTGMPAVLSSLRLRAASCSSSCRVMPCTSCSRRMDLETMDPDHEKRGDA